MATTIKTYDPAKIILNVGGARITGVETGSFITLVRNVNSFEFTVSPDGTEGTRTKLNDKSALLTVTLKQTSASNAILSNLANRDEADSDGIVPISIVDNVSSEIQYSGTGWIEKHADVAFAETDQGRPWMIRIASATFNTGGSPETAVLDATLT